MRTPDVRMAPVDRPQLIREAEQLVKKYRSLSSGTLATNMKISGKKAVEVQHIYKNWSTDTDQQIPAIDAFIGDIYSGLQVQAWSDKDRAYAQQHLLILSGLYGALRACDGIMPYRLEMGYKLPNGKSLYDFWADKIATTIHPDTTDIINLSAVEYTKALLPSIHLPVIAPKFLTVSPKTNEPAFVTVHAKIARGAFARWLIQNRIDDIAQLQTFTDLGYSFDASSSTPEQPVFICKTFEGLGLSVRLLQ
ncbi:MAG: hypothetical protein JWN75_780 [Candidatus Saccharibacteria bacterium]|nr:hypothetical protein [Candidatus Saccharibacteria bacterium]